VILQLIKENKMFVNTDFQFDAQARINEGEAPEALVHITDNQELSSSITLEQYQSGAYISTYKTLKEVASTGCWNRIDWGDDD
jgi:hypothetical protein